MLGGSPEVKLMGWLAEKVGFLLIVNFLNVIVLAFSFM